MLNNIYLLLSGLPFLVCFFWTIALSLNYKNNHISKKILFGFMSVATALYFGHFCVFNRLWHLIPVTDTIYTFSTLSVYPIYGFYLKALTGNISKKVLFQLVPALIIAGIIGICYIFLPYEIEKELLQACHYSGDGFPQHWTCLWSKYAHEAMKPLIVVQVLYTAFCGFHRLNGFKNRVERCFSNTEHRDLSEIRHLLILLLGTSVLSVIADLLGRTFFLNSLTMWSVPMIAFAIMLFGIGFVGYRQQFTIADLLHEEELATIPSTVCPDNRKILRQKLDALMETEKLYLKYDLKISEVSSLLGSNRTYVQEALKVNDDEALSFSDYVNQYRIQHSLQLLRGDEKLLMNEVMEKSGYQSRATFYRNFKKFIGKNPDQYLKDLSQ